MTVSSSDRATSCLRLHSESALGPRARQKYPLLPMVHASGDPSYRTNAHPEAFVRELVSRTRSAFVTAYGESPLLLVRVVDLSSDLAHGLTENPTAAGA